MAERSTAKSKRGEGTKGAAKAAPEAAGPSGTQAEITRLEAELAAARAQIAELEQKHAEIINRIDWVIDSLHNLND